MGVDQLIGIGVLVLGAVLIVAGRALVSRAMSARDAELLALLAEQAVRAAEQLGASGDWGGDGKFAWASARLMDLAARAGITLTADDIRVAIEAAVQVLKVSGEELHAAGRRQEAA